MKPIEEDIPPDEKQATLEEFKEYLQQREARLLNEDRKKHRRRLFWDFILLFTAAGFLQLLIWLLQKGLN